MNTKVTKIITVLVLILMITIFLCSVYAADSGMTLTPDDIVPSETKAVEKISEIGNKIAGVLQAIGVVVSVVMLLVLGIKYMTGSAEEKAVDKKSFMPYVIGAALIFAATEIAGAVIKFFM